MHYSLKQEIYFANWFIIACIYYFLLYNLFANLDMSFIDVLFDCSQYYFYTFFEVKTDWWLKVIYLILP